MIFSQRSILAVCGTGLVFGSLFLRAYASGFGLYEASTETHALGGAVLGKGVDASANFHNPATISDFTNVVVTTGFITEHPRLRSKVNGSHSIACDPGPFLLPHLSATMPLPWDFAFGFGILPEYGLGSHYSSDWDMNWSSAETTIMGIVFNPNISYAITDDWSIGGGFRFLFFDFEQYSYPQAAKDSNYYGNYYNRLKGDNDMKDFGWQIGSRYKVTDDIALGLVYKSDIDVSVHGHSRTRVNAYDFTVAEQAQTKTIAAYKQMGASDQVAKIAGAKAYSTAHSMIVDKVDSGAQTANGDANANLTLPQSIAAGFNWDITETVHLGSMVSWTEWSEFDTLVFKLPSGDKPIHLKWNDTWRYSIAPSWDFADDWTVMTSYVYDMDFSGKEESTMLPPSDRHAITLGLVWHVGGGWEMALDYGILFMSGGTMHSTDSLGNRYKMVDHRGLSHSAGFSVTYRF